MFIVSTTIFPLPEVFFLNITLLFTFLTVSILFKSFNDPIVISAAASLADYDNEQKKVWLDQLKTLFEDRKIYLDPAFRLSKLAEEIGINGRLLSRIIKDEYGQNFNEFLNYYRTNEVLRRLETPDAQSYTIMTLANEAGFNSNSAFYKAFKKQTGFNPVEYMRRKNSHQ